jgi:tetratricopeptide (TPR) repeat protein
MVGARRGDEQHRAAAIAEADALIDEDAPFRQRAALALAHGRHFAYLGDYEKALAGAERQAAIYREAGQQLGEQMALSTAAWFSCALGRIDDAIPVLQHAIATLRRIKAPYGIGGSQMVLACAYALRGDRESALAMGRDVIQYLQRTLMVVWLVPYMALLHAQQPGSEADAALLIGFFDIELKRTGRLVFPFTTDVRARVMALANAALGDAQTQAHAAAGSRLTEEQAIGLMFGASNN